MRKTPIQYILLFACVFIFSNCKKPTQFKEVQVTDLFTIQIPSYMEATNNTYPFRVALQYNNDSAAVFLMVIDTLRKGMNENTLRMYYDSVVSQPFIDSAKITEPKLINLKGDSAYTSEMTGIENGVKVFYELEAVATPTRYYMLLTWGKMDHKESLKPDFEKTLSSFSDISHK